MPSKTLGLRHVALNVRDVQKSKAFYIQVMGMRVVWEPDPRNAYLSSGSDNLALHELPAGERLDKSQSLDHLGFMVESIDEVRAWADDLAEKGVSVSQPPRTHRDGSFSLYLRDPDGNLIQILYIPDALVPGSTPTF
jgi:catechol 2,3-dioxygenase-like lactoylglutathione lyase family enzyme